MFQFCVFTFILHMFNIESIKLAKRKKYENCAKYCQWIDPQLLNSDYTILKRSTYFFVGNVYKQKYM